MATAIPRRRMCGLCHRYRHEPRRRPRRKPTLTHPAQPSMQPDALPPWRQPHASRQLSAASLPGPTGAATPCAYDLNRAVRHRLKIDLKQRFKVTSISTSNQVIARRGSPGAYVHPSDGPSVSIANTAAHRPPEANRIDGSRTLVRAQQAGLQGQPSPQSAWFSASRARCWTLHDAPEHVLLLTANRPPARPSPTASSVLFPKSRQTPAQ